VAWGANPQDYDAEALERTLTLLGRLFGDGRYFGVEATGFERVAEAPAMVVSNHSGGTTVLDAWGLGVAWYDHFGTARPLHPAAHEMVLGNRWTGPYMARRGVVRASREVARRVLEHWREDLLVMPGGDLDVWRPFRHRYRVKFGGRTGYARVALSSGVPVVPVAHVGAHHTFLVLTDGRGLAEGRPVGVALLEEAVPSFGCLVGAVGEAGRLTGEHLLADQPVVDEVERELEHPLRGRALGADLAPPLECGRLQVRVGHDLLTAPIATMSSAVYSRPRKKISRANFWPTWRARYADPKPPSKLATSASVCLNLACSVEARVRSLTTCSEWPPPAAHPGTTQITTLGMNRIRRCTSRMCSRPARPGSMVSAVVPSAYL
jgi:1-acyl-sn-glycerol-3-phosphate acyltransferase